MSKSLLYRHIIVINQCQLSVNMETIHQLLKASKNGVFENL